MVKLARLGGGFYNPEFLLPPGSNLRLVDLKPAGVAARILRPRSTACTARINIIAGMKTIGAFPKISLESIARSNS